MKLLLFGAPGSGKSTQGDFLHERFGVPKISTGDILREEQRRGTRLGKLADGAIHDGRLVDDEVMIGIIQNRLKEPDCQSGYLLDGFPRTLAQAEALEKVIKAEGGHFDRVLYLSVPAEELVERLSNRLVCPQDGQTYNLLFHPPKVAGICDRDGTPLIRREDDSPETARRRIEVYLRDTAPALDFYRRRDLVADIDGTLPIQQVHELIENAVLEGIHRR